MFGMLLTFKLIRSIYLRRIILKYWLLNRHFGAAVIADEIYHRHKNEYVSCNPSSRFSIIPLKWYGFEDHRWYKMRSFPRQIVIELVDKYLSLIREATPSKRLTQITKKLEDFKTHNSKKLDNSLQFRFHRNEVNFEMNFENFERNFETNPYLICFTNGVYDLKTFQFRAGRPNDYCYLMTGYAYLPHEIPDSSRREVTQFLEQIFPDPRNYQQALTVISSFLIGGQSGKNFYILFGKGCCGRTSLMKLVMKTLGEYAILLPTELMQKQKNHLNPLGYTKYKRLVYFIGDMYDDPIGIANLRKPFYAQAPYQPEEFIDPTVSFVASCDDENLCSRYPHQVIYFTSKFVKNPKEPHELKQDSNLDSKIESWKEAFLLILIDHLRKGE